MSQHHPSCTPNDRDLVWLCAQCGSREDASELEDDTKRLAHFIRRCADHMICGSNIAETPLPTEQEWREILAICDAAIAAEGGK